MSAGDKVRLVGGNMQVDGITRRAMRSAAGANGPKTISSFPNPFPGNPYLDILYRHLEHEGIRYVQSGHLGKQWLIDNRRKVECLHIHWPGYAYANRKGRASVGKALVYA